MILEKAMDAIDGMPVCLQHCIPKSAKAKPRKFNNLNVSAAIKAQA